MLSIGKVGMSDAQQMYYEQQVAAGREDYYAGQGEAPGRWTGSGAQGLGLSGELDAEQLKAMMDGTNAKTGERLANRTGHCTTAAIDMTFSAPKSVSVLFAVGDEQLSRALVAAHEEAVDAAVEYMEGGACKVRRGHNGTAAERAAGDPRGWERARSEPADGFVAAAYRHRMSRAQDPQLHTHVVAANMARGADGRWTALDARHIYEHAKAGGSVYQAHLRAAVRERLAWASWGPQRNGMAELEQVPPGVLEEFSTRRRRILERERELVADGVAVGDIGRERIAYDTREVKHEVNERDWRTEIQARAAEHGLGTAELAELTELLDAPAPELVSESALAERLFSPSGLTATTNTFRERDVVIAVAAAHPQGAAASEVTAIARRMLEHDQAVKIPDRLDRRYTTRELLDAERRIVAHATEGRGQQAAIVDQRDIDRALATLPTALTAEQQDVVIAIASSGNRIDTVEALAGTGKTTSAAALREVYEHAGYRVLGAAPTGRAVRELKERARIEESRTLDGWVVKLGADPDALRFAEATELGVYRVPAVMIIDEAGMAHTRLSAKLIDAAVDAHVKVVAIGDSGQLSSVQAGGWLGALTRQLGSHELREVMRQRDPQERRGLARVHRGQPDSYLQSKTERGELEVFAGAQPGVDAEHAAIARWTAARETHGEREAVLICRDNERRERLNELAREHLKDRGELGESVQIAGREWAVGDRVIARRNDRGRDLDNGMRATITHVDPRNGVTIQADTGGVRALDIDYATHHLEHAYALTGHGMQGGTVQWAAVVGQPGDFTRNWSYTALSRAREPTEILLIDEPSRTQREREEIAPAQDPAGRSDALERMGARMRERDDEDLALEQLEHARAHALAEQGTGTEPEASTSPEPSRTTEPHQRQPASAVDREHDATREPELADVVDKSAGDLEIAAPSGVLAELAGASDELAAVREALADPVIADARALADLHERIGAIHTEARLDSKPKGWRDPAAQAYRARVRDRELELTTLRQDEQLLAARVGDPTETLHRAEQLQERQQQLLTRSLALRERAIGEELERKPAWLEQTLGPEPDQRSLKERWQRTAREMAAHRIRNQITDPADPGVHPHDIALTRSISDARAHLGLDLPTPGHDHGIEN
ncbi:MAG: MobF family relaxase [Solirubrobacteraceae bacterium]